MPDRTNTNTSDTMSPSRRPPEAVEHDGDALFRVVGGCIVCSIDDLPPSDSSGQDQHLAGNLVSGSSGEGTSFSNETRPSLATTKSSKPASTSDLLHILSILISIHDTTTVHDYEFVSSLRFLSFTLAIRSSTTCPPSDAPPWKWRALECRGKTLARRVLRHPGACAGPRPAVTVGPG
eukprot:754862-Hanusia_phi.AAC.1